MSTKNRLFAIRLANLILVVCLIVGYQYVALDRAEKEAAAQAEAIKVQQEQANQADSGAASASPYQDGTFSGEGQGYGGMIEVDVTIEDGIITVINVTEAAGEDAAYFDAALGMIPRILEQQDPNVDTASGATLSSVGLHNAVITALKKAVK